MKLIELQCPKCKNSLVPKENEKMLHCSFCGTTVYLDDEVPPKRKEIRKSININKKYVNVDKVIHEKAALEKSRRQEKEEKKENRLLFGLLAFIVLMIVCMIFYKDINRIVHHRDISEYIIMPASSESFHGDIYADVKKELEEAGFQKIECVKDVPDSKLDKLLLSPDEVIKVKVNGELVEAGEKYYKDDEIIIYYYEK